MVSFAGIVEQGLWQETKLSRNSRRHFFSSFQLSGDSFDSCNGDVWTLQWWPRDWSFGYFRCIFASPTEVQEKTSSGWQWWLWLMISSLPSAWQDNEMEQGDGISSFVISWKSIWTWNVARNSLRSWRSTRLMVEVVCCCMWMMCCSQCQQISWSRRFCCPCWKRLSSCLPIGLTERWVEASNSSRGFTFWMLVLRDWISMVKPNMWNSVLTCSRRQTKESKQDFIALQLWVTLSPGEMILLFWMRLCLELTGLWLDAFCIFHMKGQMCNIQSNVWPRIWVRPPSMLGHSLEGWLVICTGLLDMVCRCSWHNLEWPCLKS